VPAYVHVNLRILDAARQAALAPRFREALERAGGRVHHFGPVTDVLEGKAMPLPLAGLFEFPSREAALAFYRSDAYAPIREERSLAQEARMYVVDVA
jgi:uncharacterized protein (DUF1330 family)